MPTLKTSISGIRGIIGDGLDISTIVDLFFQRKQKS